MQQGGNGHKLIPSYLMSSPVHTCVCMHAYIFVYFQKISENTKYISLYLPMEAKYLWLEHHSPEEAALLYPSLLQERFPNTNRVPLCSRFT